MPIAGFLAGLCVGVFLGILITCLLISCCSKAL